MRSWIGRASVVASFIAYGACMARAQLPCALSPNCPTDRGDDVAFEITVEYYDWDPFFGGETITGFWGPVINQIQSTPRNVTTGPRIQTTIVGGSVSGGSLFADFANTAFVNARRIDAHIFGNGARLRARVYIKGSPGTPYYAIRSASGNLNASFPQGLGRADSFFGSFAASSVNGAGPRETILGSDADGDGAVEDREFDLSVTRGTTSSTQLLIQGVPYTLATEIVFDMHGGILQSLDFCFPFVPCNAMDYYAAGTARVAVDAGIGNPPCAGTLSVKKGSCTTTAGSVPNTQSMFQQFKVFARFENGNGASCGCCRYEQYVRRVDVFIHENGKDLPIPVRRGGANPCDANAPSKQGCCPVEDSLCKGGSCRLAYGDRTVVVPCVALSTDGYYDPNGTPNQANGCVYESLDQPGFHDAGVDGTTRSYRYRADFVGRIVSTCPTPGDPVIAERRWTVDCTDAFAMYGGGEGVTPGRIATTYFTLAGRQAAIAVANDGVNSVFGALRFEALPAESVLGSQINIVVADATNQGFSSGRLTQFSDGLQEDWVAPFSASYAQSLPNAVSIDVTWGAASASVLVSLLAGDIDGDGDVDPADLGILLANWDTTVPVGRLGDLDGNGFVDPADLGILLADWP